MHTDDMEQFRKCCWIGRRISEPEWRIRPPLELNCRTKLLAILRWYVHELNIAAIFPSIPQNARPVHMIIQILVVYNIHYCLHHGNWLEHNMPLHREAPSSVPDQPFHIRSPNVGMCPKHSSSPESMAVSATRHGEAEPTYYLCAYAIGRAI